MSIANNVMNKTCMSGFAELVTAMSDPQRYERAIFNSRIVGASRCVAMMARAMDPLRWKPIPCLSASVEAAHEKQKGC